MSSTSAQQNICLLIPTIDSELLILAEERKRLASAGIMVLVSDAELVSFCRDKRQTVNLFSSIGIDSPAILDPQSLSYPCFVRPISGSSSKGVRSIPSALHLSTFEKDDPNNLFQEFVPSTWQEYSVDCWFSRDSRLISMVPRERIETRGGEISKGVTRRGAVLSLLRPSLERLQSACGCLTVQVFRSDQILGIESTGFGGGYPQAVLVLVITMMIRSGFW